ncbi:MAG: hypothetical protein QOF03_1165, partial [Alphaproteobacteria bacterium]|nr:hypothetical protein [Alphaproteobacteria bacterium]
MRALFAREPGGGICFDARPPPDPPSHARRRLDHPTR